MLIINSLKELNIEKKTSVALGNFDGLHVGHRKIMEHAIHYAKEYISFYKDDISKTADESDASLCKSSDEGDASLSASTNERSVIINDDMKSLCFTFSNHPFNFIMGRDESDPDAVKLICSENEKVRLIEEMGFDILVNVPFDEQIMTMDAADFFADIVVGKLNAGCVSVGFNYSYGARATGTPDTLKAECAKVGIACNIHEAVKIDDEVVSSTLIRQMIAKGDMESTAKYLGRPYAFRGTVSHGKRLGTAMGIPTVNIPAPTDIMLPPNGVYFSRILIDGSEFKSVSNIGIRPTVSDIYDATANVSNMPDTAANECGVPNSSIKVKDEVNAVGLVSDTNDEVNAVDLASDIKTVNQNKAESQKNIETNIFDFSGDLYGKEIVVCFDHFSRAEAKFDSKEELFKQIEQDCKDAKTFFNFKI